MTAPHLTALADQLTAANADAERTLHAAHHRGAGTRLSHVRPHPWLAGHAAALGLALAYGTAHLCPHIGPAQRVVHAAVWAPGRLVCPLCIRQLRPSTVEDSTCDRCHRHAPRLHAAAAAFGPILLGYGLCPNCQHDIDTAHRCRKERHQ
ncbi:MAG TPA: hypothetical protein VFM55_10305 [Micromonosporaceae bacterium]|nr:hypothetical protein [Micromonosporaceae bacterium]